MGWQPVGFLIIWVNLTETESKLRMNCFVIRFISKLWPNYGRRTPVTRLTSCATLEVNFRPLLQLSKISDNMKTRNRFGSSHFLFFFFFFKKINVTWKFDFSRGFGWYRHGLPAKSLCCSCTIPSQFSTGEMTSFSSTIQTCTTRTRSPARYWKSVEWNGSRCR